MPAELPCQAYRRWARRDPRRGPHNLCGSPMTAGASNRGDPTSPLTPMAGLDADPEVPHGVPSARKQHAVELFAGLPRHYDLIASLFSFGQDPRWRRAMVGVLRASVEHRVLDVATGTGMVAEALVRSSGCSVVALDQSEDMSARARQRVGGSAVLRDRVSVLQGE